MSISNIRIINSLSEDVRISIKITATIYNGKVGYLAERALPTKYWEEESEAELIIEIEKVEEGD